MSRWLPDAGFRRRREEVGFYTTRFVAAEDEESAEVLAVALVRAELSENGLSAFQGDNVILRREQLDELESFGEALVPGRGFTFFPRPRRAVGKGFDAKHLC
jgi:hypothetical protein